MEEILYNMYVDVEKLADHEENKELLKAAIQEHTKKAEGSDAVEEMKSKLFIQHLQERLEAQEKEINTLEISILRGKYQIETQSEQQVVEDKEGVLEPYNQEIEQLQSALKEQEEKKAEAMKNIQAKIDQYYNAYQQENVPEDIKRIAKDAAAQEIDALDAARANVEQYYAEQFEDIETKINEIEEKKKEVLSTEEPILTAAKEMAVVVNLKENRLEKLQELAQKGKEYRQKREAERVKAEVPEEQRQAENLEEATAEEQEKMQTVVTGLGTYMPIGQPVVKKPVQVQKNVIPKEKGDTETMKDLEQEPEEIKKQKVKRISVDVSMGKVYIMLEPKEGEEEKTYKFVEKIEFDQEEELKSVHLMEEKKIELLKKHIPEFAQAFQAVQEAKAKQENNKEAEEAYATYLSNFQNADPIVIHALDTLERSEAIQQYVEAISQKDIDKMPFNLDYDLRKMKEAEFNMEEKENILSYAKANRAVADEIRGSRGAGMHLRLRRFEQKHVWFGKMMRWMRAEEEPKALAKQNEVMHPKENKKESIVEKATVDHEEAMRRAAEAEKAMQEAVKNGWKPNKENDIEK